MDVLWYFISSAGQWRCELKTVALSCKLWWQVKSTHVWIGRLFKGDIELLEVGIEKKLPQKPNQHINIWFYLII